MDHVFLSVVIPSYDEMSNLKKGVLDRVTSFLDNKKFAYEVIVVDDGSEDGSVSLIEKYCKTHKKVTLLKNPHLGKAGAITSGMLIAKGEYLLFTDMDQATPIEEIDKLLPYFNDGYDVVIGSRNRERKGAPLSRLVLSPGMMIVRTIIVGLRGITDTQCGFKMFTKTAGKKLFVSLKDLHNGFQKIHGSSVTAAFDVELLLIAQHMHLKIKEVSVVWSYVESRRVSPVKDSLDAVKDLLKIRKNLKSGKYTYAND